MCCCSGGLGVACSFSAASDLQQRSECCVCEREREYTHVKYTNVCPICMGFSKASCSCVLAKESCYAHRWWENAKQRLPRRLALCLFVGDTRPSKQHRHKKGMCTT